eukprot:TRINITY_DN71152_c0_g1_i1.p1 TRINITY_DN71152_c0_g1~~TRINITY_DN71152_c0_g1_i1.p1  ORF type:complete len:348 (+),score=56.65 TRINITY_DN71152_c0_g1_i1:135-1178(+)
MPTCPSTNQRHLGNPRRKGSNEQLWKDANDAYEQGDLERAAKLYSKIIKFAPSADAHTSRAAVYLMLGRSGRAWRDLQAASHYGTLECEERTPILQHKMNKAPEEVVVNVGVDSKVTHAGMCPTRCANSAIVPEIEFVGNIGASAPACAAVTAVRCSEASVTFPQTLSDITACFTDRAEWTESSCPTNAHSRKEQARELMERLDAFESVIPCANNTLDAIASHADGEARAQAFKLLKVTSGLLEVNDRWHQKFGEHSHSKPELEDVASLGNIAYADGCASDAIKFYTRGIEQSAGSVDVHSLADFYYNRSLAHRQLGSFADALEDVATALALNSQWAKELDSLAFSF